MRLQQSEIGFRKQYVKQDVMKPAANIDAAADFATSFAVSSIAVCAATPTSPFPNPAKTQRAIIVAPRIKETLPGCSKIGAHFIQTPR